MSQLAVVAFITALPGREAALEAELSSLVDPTRQEAGCLRYDLVRDSADPRRLAFLETWASREALQAHMKTPHFLGSRQRQEGLVETREAKVLDWVR